MRFFRLRDWARSLLGRSPSAEEWTQRGVALYNKEKYAEALPAFDEALRLKPLLAQALTSRGLVHYKLGNLTAAIADLNACVAVAPHLALGYENRGGFFLLEHGDYDRALPDLDETIRLDPKHANAYLLRGQLWLMKGELDLALKDCHRAIQLGKDDANAYQLRGVVLMDMGELDRAIADFSEALLRDRTYFPALRQRGLAWFFKGDFDQAIADANEAIRLKPDDAIAHNNRGAALMHKGQSPQAVAEFNEAIRLDPKHPNAYKNYAWLLATCEDPSLRDGARAVEYALLAMELVKWKETSWLEILAAAYAESGDFDAAIKWETKYLAESRPAAKPEIQSRLDLYQSHESFRYRPPRANS